MKKKEEYLEEPHSERPEDSDEINISVSQIRNEADLLTHKFPVSPK